MKCGQDRVRVPHERIAVRLLRCHVLVADRIARARPVHHQHALTEVARHAVGEEAGRLTSADEPAGNSTVISRCALGNGGSCARQ